MPGPARSVSGNCRVAQVGARERKSGMHLRIFGISRNARGNQFRGSGIEDGREKLVLPRFAVGRGERARFASSAARRSVHRK
jgi:hypothetical protein